MTRGLVLVDQAQRQGYGRGTGRSMGGGIERESHMGELEHQYKDVVHSGHSVLRLWRLALHSARAAILDISISPYIV